MSVGPSNTAARPRTKIELEMRWRAVVELPSRHLKFEEVMNMGKFTLDIATSPAEFTSSPIRLNRPLVAIAPPRRWLAIVLGLASLALVLVAVTRLTWQDSSGRPTAQPLSGTWACSLAGQPIGALVIDGRNYMLGTADSGEPRAGTIEVVGKHTKMQEEFLRVQGGPLLEEFGVRLGFHNRAVEPPVLVFNVGPGSGIHCLLG